MLFFKKDGITSINDVLNKYNSKEFNSPFRSTIPLIVLFKQDNNLQIDSIAKQSNSNTKYVFEYETPVAKGKGLPSCTDLMIINSNSAISIEAKRTEPKYQKVGKWLNAGEDKQNRIDVLEGWLELIFKKTDILLTKEQLHDYPYQMIHRVASACYIDKIETSVYYIGFDLTNSMKEYYAKYLNDLSILLSNKIHLELICFQIDKTKNQLELEKRWENGERDLTNEVLSGIVNNKLMDFV